MTHRLPEPTTPVAALDRCIFLMARGAPHPSDTDEWRDTLRQASIIAERHAETGDAPPVKSIWLAAALWLALIAGLLTLGFWASPALAHDWYPRSCCSDKDCFTTGLDNVTATKDGWRVESSGEVLPYDDPRIKPTPPRGRERLPRLPPGGRPQAAGPLPLCAELRGVIDG